MKPIFFKKATLLAVMLGVVSSCTKDFEAINTNPNNPTSASADLFLPYGIQSAVDMYVGGSLGQDVGNLFAQHWARIQYTDADRYIVTNDVISNGWRDFYVEPLANYQRIIKIADETQNSNYKAVALIMRSWVFSVLTDLYGDIPYNDAIKGIEGTLKPTYDAQKDVYVDLVKTLQAANDMIVLNNADMAVSGDILLGGNMLKWKKFANSLSLRILNRMNGKVDVSADINRILGDPGKYPVLASNADNVQLAYLSGAPNNNPVNENRKTRDDHRISATIVNKLKSLNDARLTVYADLPADGGDYKGVPNGLSNSDANALGLSKTSKVGSYFTAATAPGVLMTYAELLFIKSELAFKGIASAGDAATNYKDAITASFKQYNLTVSPEYLATNALKSGNEGYVQIMEQKWIALYGQGLEAWTEYRRTGIPALKAPASNANNDVIPTRLAYPGSEESLNYVNFNEALTRQGGQNTMRLKLWFAK
ncbi:SusD/RagB family nutrient-binding outer membrane lipoprotein [Salmonirosea aquatica]|uniref:SusD/RagB family nutrient-binding outer membrane lipoprotein n=1 Tax=Salmonirosea aquatica TaxID=2654236 RepID=A0A7C9FMT6_9BACT|nr:SusD/RagB family nutrient-binding outer membrane lipoprotein [Cytophagaceae bacterium SJW1-29]